MRTVLIVLSFYVSFGEELRLRPILANIDVLVLDLRRSRCWTPEFDRIL